MHNKSRLHKLYVLVALALIGILFPTGTIENPDANVRLRQSENYLESGSLTLPDGVGEAGHGNLAKTKDGKITSVYNLGQILLFSATGLTVRAICGSETDWATLTFVHSFLGPSSLILTAWFVYLIVWGQGRRAPLMCAVMCLIATPLLTTSTDSYEQSWVGLLFTFATWCILRAKREEGDSRGCLSYISGMAIGGAILFRAPAILALPIFAYLEIDNKKRAKMIIGTLPFVISTFTYNYIRFGNALEFGYESAWANAGGYFPERDFFTLKGTLIGAFGLLLSPGKGLFVHSPILFPGVCAIFLAATRTKERLPKAIILLSTIYIAFYGSNFAWHGSIWSWGPRYLVPIIPLLCIGISYIKVQKSPLRAVLLLLTAISVSNQLAGTLVDHRRALIEHTVKAGDLPDDKAMSFSLIQSPIYLQYKSLATFLETGDRENLNDYTYPGPWRNTSRPASISMMLADSVQFNTLNTWWADNRWFSKKVTGSWARLIKITWPITIVIVCILLSRTSRKSRQKQSGS